MIDKEDILSLDYCKIFTKGTIMDETCDTRRNHILDDICVLVWSTSTYDPNKLATKPIFSVLFWSWLALVCFFSKFSKNVRCCWAAEKISLKSFILLPSNLLILVSKNQILLLSLLLFMQKIRPFLIRFKTQLWFLFHLETKDQSQIDDDECWV